MDLRRMVTVLSRAGQVLELVVAVVPVGIFIFLMASSTRVTSTRCSTRHSARVASIAAILMVILGLLHHPANRLDRALTMMIHFVLIVGLFLLAVAVTMLARAVTLRTARAPRRSIRSARTGSRDRASVARTEGGAHVRERLNDFTSAIGRWLGQRFSRLRGRTTIGRASSQPGCTRQPRSACSGSSSCVPSPCRSSGSGSPAWPACRCGSSLSRSWQRSSSAGCCR